MTTDTSAPEQAPKLSPGMRKGVMALGTVAMIQNIDPAANSIAVVPASNDLAMTASQYSLATSVGTLFLAATILAGGAFGDRLGRKKVMITGTLLAGTGAVISALAPVPLLFLLGRSLTGIGVGFCFGLSFALIRSTAPGVIPQAVALWITVQMGGTLLLSLVSGALININWRLGYVAIAGVAALAFLLVGAARKDVPEATSEHVGKLDVAGLVSVGLGLVALIYGISSITTEGLGSPIVLGSLMAAILLLGFFFWWEARIDEPALPVGVFKDREMGAAVASIFSYNMWQAVLALQMVMFLTYIARYSSFTVSLAQLPMMFVMVIGAMITGRILARGVQQKTLILLGHLLMIASAVFMFLATESATFLFFLVPQIIGGMGRIMAETSLAPWFVMKPPPDLTGAVGSSKTAFGQTAFGLGSALSATVLYVSFGQNLKQAFLESKIPAEQQGVFTGMIQQYFTTGTLDGEADTVQRIIDGSRDLYLSSFHSVFTLLVFVQVFLFVVTFLLLAKGRKDQAEETAVADA